MGTIMIKFKLMPESLDTNLEEVKKNAQEIIEGFEGRNCNFEEEPIAFGLKAVLVSFAREEGEEIEPVEEALAKIDSVNSVKLIDMRRAFG